MTIGDFQKNQKNLLNYRICQKQTTNYLIFRKETRLTHGNLQKEALHYLEYRISIPGTDTQRFDTGVVIPG